MFNVILDPYPDNYKGYLIRYDFRIAIQIILALEDETLTDGEKWAAALLLLFGEGIPKDRSIAVAGLRWFMSGGIDDEDREENGEPQEDDGEQEEKAFDYDYDASRLHSAFLRAYNINLNKVRLHWFEFRGLMQDLGECALSSVIEYRTKNLNGLPPKQRSEYAKLKKKYALPRKLSDEDKEKMEEFIKALSIPQNVGT